ncbi:hypothetical protein L2E82_16010 [Cichorium intybus]|uniref:Uncharacterized protein n=1 Tax=Cichorium intybus TaxID=13427 RepID=A0ACB9F5B8_CICIN|nr:hypothetical protein L2E82_16010 [Cichorium intybus]
MHRLSGKFKKSLLGSTFVFISVCGTKRKLLKVKKLPSLFLDLCPLQWQQNPMWTALNASELQISQNFSHTDINFQLPHQISSFVVYLLPLIPPIQF